MNLGNELFNTWCEAKPRLASKFPYPVATLHFTSNSISCGRGLNSLIRLLTPFLYKSNLMLQNGGLLPHNT
jgi:hypothetical protein